MPRKLLKFLILFDNTSLLYFPGQFLSGRVLIELQDDTPALGKNIKLATFEIYGEILLPPLVIKLICTETELLRYNNETFTKSILVVFALFTASQINRIFHKANLQCQYPWNSNEFEISNEQMLRKVRVNY